MLNFREYLQIIEEYSLPSDYAGGAIIPTGSTSYQSPNIWTVSTAGEVPQHGIGLPAVTRRGKVVSVEYKPGGNVEIHLEDQTVLRLTYGDFKRIGGAPVVPHESTLTVVFQRSPTDHGQFMSQITKITCEYNPKVRTEP